MTGFIIGVLAFMVGVVLIARGAMEAQQHSGASQAAADPVKSMRPWLVDVLKRGWPILNGAPSSPGERSAAAGLLVAGVSLLTQLVLIAYHLSVSSPAG
jgi:hypothetical protein